MAASHDMFTVLPPNPARSFVRYTLIVLIVLSLLFSLTFATVGMLVVLRIQSEVTDLQRVAIYIHIIVYVYFTLVCAFGIYAIGVMQTYKTSIFMSLVISQILFSLGSGALCLYLLYRKDAVCLALFNGQFMKDLCNNGPVLQGITTALFVVMWLVEITTIILGNSYLAQLYEEAMRIEMFDPRCYDDDPRTC